MIMEGPVTSSPPAKTFGREVASVSGSAWIVPSRFNPSSFANGRVLGLSPTASTAMSAGRVTPDPSTGTGRRRPLASGSPSFMESHSTATSFPFSPRNRFGVRSSWSSTPSSRAAWISKSWAGISARLLR